MRISDWSSDVCSSDLGKVVPGDAFKAYLDGLVAEPPKVATRKASENTLSALTADIASLVGGSADLTGSNNTKTSSTKPLTKNDYSGRYIYRSEERRAGKE